VVATKAQPLEIKGGYQPSTQVICSEFPGCRQSGKPPVRSRGAPLPFTCGIRLKLISWATSLWLGLGYILFQVHEWGPSFPHYSALKGMGFALSLGGNIPHSQGVARFFSFYSPSLELSRYDLTVNDPKRGIFSKDNSPEHGVDFLLDKMVLYGYIRRYGTAFLIFYGSSGIFEDQPVTARKIGEPGRDHFL